MFYSFFFVMRNIKNIENNKLREYKNCVFCVFQKLFSRIVFKNINLTYPLFLTNLLVFMTNFEFNGVFVLPLEFYYDCKFFRLFF